MAKFSITDLPAGESRIEKLLGGSVEVRSRSGLHPVEVALVEAMPKYAAKARHLVTGNRTGVLPMALAAADAAAQPHVSGCTGSGRIVVAHDFDIHHVRAVARNVAANGFGRVGDALPREPFVADAEPIALSCAEKLPDGGFDVVWIQASKTNTAAEVAQEWLEQAHGALAEGGVCVVGIDGPEAWMQEQMKRVFGKVSAFPPCGGARVLAARKAGPLRRRRDFSATFEASLPDGLAPIALKTVPGVFAHRRPDAGGLALAEVAREYVKPGDTLLDLGCGCGLVGLLLARHVAVGADAGACAVPGGACCGRVVLVDSDARAFACTRANAAANGLDGCCGFVLNDEGVGGGPAFDVVVGNPPYYSDYAIAGRFIREAGDVLKPGGIALIVARDASHHAELLEKFVGPAKIENRRGYQVAIARRQCEGER